MSIKIVIGPKADSTLDIPEGSSHTVTDFNREQIMEILANIRSVTPWLDTFEAEDFGEHSVLVTVEKGATLDELGATYWNALLPALREWYDAGNPLTVEQ